MPIDAENPETSIIKELERVLEIKSPSPLQSIQWPLISKDIYIKRDDLLHGIISGNKWRKLQYPLARAIMKNYRHILSFGGGYSNHIHALAYACKQLNLTCSLIIRGDYSQNLTPTLKDVIGWGANVHFVDKKTYARRTDTQYLHDLARIHNADYLLPEGGTDSLGIQGLDSLLNEVRDAKPINTLLLPVGSAGTLTGLIKTANTEHVNVDLIGVSVLNAGNSHENQIKSLYPDAVNFSHWQILDDFHHGGYAKTSAELRRFTQKFVSQTGIPLDNVYNAKSFYALNHLLTKTSLLNKKTVCILQTGGCQGNR